MASVTQLEFTLLGIKSWIIHQLGGGKYEESEDGQLVEQPDRPRIELTVAELETCVWNSVEDYSRAVPKVMRGFLAVETEVHQYKLPEYGRGVIEVQPNRRETYLLDNQFNFGFPIPLYVETDATELDVLDYELASRIYSYEVDWEFHRPYLYITNLPNNVTGVVYVYIDNYKDLGEIIIADRKWIRERSLMYAKKILAKIRGKFKDVPGAGGSMALDAEELKAEAETMETELDEDLIFMARSVPPLFG